MPHCIHCGSEVQATDRFCEHCGKPVVLPDARSVRRATDKAARQAERLQEREAAEQYYRRVGSRHPHIWPVTGIGRALYLVCIAATALAVHLVGAAAPDLAGNPVMRIGLAAAAGVAAWFALTVVRYTMFPEVRPHNNPDMMGEKGDFWAFLIGIPLILLAVIGWLMR
jgi:hypothetical protein